MGRPPGRKNRTLEERQRDLLREQRELKLKQKIAAKDAEIDALKRRLKA